MEVSLLQPNLRSHFCHIGFTVFLRRKVLGPAHTHYQEAEIIGSHLRGLPTASSSLAPVTPQSLLCQSHFQIQSTLRESRGRVASVRQTSGAACLSCSHTCCSFELISGQMVPRNDYLTPFENVSFSLQLNSSQQTPTRNPPSTSQGT